MQMPAELFTLRRSLKSKEAEVNREMKRIWSLQADKQALMEEKKSTGQ